MIIDGGKGQLAAVLDVMREMGVKDIPTVGLAKQHEEIYVQDVSEPVVLPRNSQALYLVQRIRDEAHRFAITYHRGVRKKAGFQSALDTIPGVGPKRKKALLKKFGSVRGIREAPVEDIASTVGFTAALAAKVKASVYDRRDAGRRARHAVDALEPVSCSRSVHRATTAMRALAAARERMLELLRARVHDERVSAPWPPSRARVRARAPALARVRRRRRCPSAKARPSRSRSSSR